MNTPRALRVGIDVGGTFTDVVVLRPDGTAIARKVLSTPPEFNRGIRQGLEWALRAPGLPAEDVGELVHGATVATNAIIERTGPITGLITTRGFRDVLEIRRTRVHKLYDLDWEKPEPLVPRHLRLEVRGRMTPRGEVDEPLDEAEVRAAARRLLDEGVTSLAVCLLHAYANGAQEVRVRDLVREVAPELPVSLSFEVLPEIREYERTSTTVINAYVQPVVSRYFQAMERDLGDLGVRVPLMVMQSSGGMLAADVARTRPIYIIESGPAAGVTGAVRLGERMALPNLLSLDMGGTTAKAALIEEGRAARSPEYEIGGALSAAHQVIKGSGYLLRVPSIDLAEVGAGGGSLASVAAAGGLRVGPRSAGALPGPACYAQGGAEPTLTDANVVLGLINPVALAGGALPIDPGLAEAAIRDRVAGPLGLSMVEAAWGIRTVATATLVRASRAVSVERGRDPRGFALIAFGGCGPAHAADLARQLGMTRVIIPPLPGLFSSLGLLFADVTQDFVQTCYASLDDPPLERLNAIVAELIQAGQTALGRQGYDGARAAVDLSADARYTGQDYALTVPLGAPPLTRTSLAGLGEAFEREHEATYGYRSEGEGIQVIALRATARGLSDAPRVPPALRVLAGGAGEPAADRRVYLGAGGGWAAVPVIGRAGLGLGRVRGPLLVEEPDAATFIPSDWTAALDAWSNIVLEPV